MGWKPKDNPNGIGSSKAFATMTPIQHNDTIHATTILVGATAVPIQQDDSRIEPSHSAASHHDDRDDLEGATAVPTQNKKTPEDSTQLAASQLIDNEVTATTLSIELQNDVDIIPKDRLPSTSIHVLENISNEVHNDIPVVTPAIMVTPISHSPAITNNTFRIQLENVFDKIARDDLEENQEHILSQSRKQD